MSRNGERLGQVRFFDGATGFFLFLGAALAPLDFAIIFLIFLLFRMYIVSRRRISLLALGGEGGWRAGVGEAFWAAAVLLLVWGGNEGALGRFVVD